MIKGQRCTENNCDTHRALESGQFKILGPLDSSQGHGNPTTVKTKFPTSQANQALRGAEYEFREIDVSFLTKLQNKNLSSILPYKAPQSFVKSFHNWQNTAFPCQSVCFVFLLSVCVWIRKNIHKLKDSKN